MPIYEYVCKNCRHAFELLVSGSSKPKCPKCESGKLEKQHSVFAANVKEGGRGTPQMSPAPCGTCNDPRGPGACMRDGF
jgi:putative FmdB family regulatory protein